jgi:hypothetical protein
MRFPVAPRPRLLEGGDVGRGDRRRVRVLPEWERSWRNWGHDGGSAAPTGRLAVASAAASTKARANRPEPSLRATVAIVEDRIALPNALLQTRPPIVREDPDCFRRRRWQRLATAHGVVTVASEELADVPAPVLVRTM